MKNLTVAVIFLLGLVTVQAEAGGVNKTVINVDFPDFNCDSSTSICETFTATGGVICPSGTAVSFNTHDIFNNPPAASTFHLDKLLTCDDDSGTITIQVQAKSRPGAPTDSGGFVVIDGTGDYEALHGGGSLVGDLTTYPNGIIDHYTGVLSK